MATSPMIRTPRSRAVGPQGRPFALEADLVGDRAASPKSAPNRSSSNPALAEVRDLGPRDGGPGLAEQPPPRGKGRAGLVGRAVAVRGSERQHLPPALAGGGEPVDEPVGLAAERPPGSEVMWSWTPLERCRVFTAWCLPQRGGRIPSARERHQRFADRPVRRPRSQPAGTAPDRDPVPDAGRRRRRYPVKRCVGDPVRVEADIFRDGHDLLRAVVRYRGPGDGDWRRPSWSASTPTSAACAGRAFEIDRPGRWQYTIEAWTDVFGTWRDELRRKVAAGQQDLEGELSEGVVLLDAAAEQPRTPDGPAADRARPRPAARTLMSRPAPSMTLRSARSCWRR